MTSHGESRLSQTSWGLGAPRRRSSAFSGLVDGTVLLLAWVALWTVFVLGVVEPAARLTRTASPAAQVEGSRT